MNQYKRLANVYFLVLCLISSFPGIAPWDPIVQITPTIFVMVVSILREFVEDLLRYKSDQLSN